MTLCCLTQQSVYLFFTKLTKHFFKIQSIDFTLNLVYDVAIFRNPGVFKKKVENEQMGLYCQLCKHKVKGVENLINVVEHINSRRHEMMSQKKVREIIMFKL